MLQKYQKQVHFFHIMIVVLLAMGLRFPYLGYSDYIGDEHKAFFERDALQSTSDFFLSQRKGPMQFVISEIPKYFFVGDFKNELAQRIPFTVINLFCVIVFYELIFKITKRRLIAFISTFLLLVNGFIVGFSRIAQYQNLNLFFSFAALYFYVDLLRKRENLIRQTLLGTLMFSLSLLSHWDVIFIIPPVVVIFLWFLKSTEFDRKFKVKLLVVNFLFGCFVLLPFLIPYIKYQLATPDNARYFSRRIELGHVNYLRYKELIELYNPFVALWVYVIGGVLGALFIRKSYLFVAWFLSAYLFFELFVRKPGTHIYNFLIPVFVLVAIGVVNVGDYFEVLLGKISAFKKKRWKIVPKLLGSIPVLLFLIIIGFLYYQSYIIFIDHKVEYPWSREVIFGHKTKKYTLEDKLPLFGFPHKRYWKEINEYVLAHHYEYAFMTNEVKTISEYYMDTRYGTSDGFYAIGIKRPLSFVNNWKLTIIGGKRTVHEIQNEFGETVVRIYQVDDVE